MQNSFFEIIGIKIPRFTEEEALRAAREKSPRRLFFANAHAIMCARQDEDFRVALRDAELVLNDGVGLDLALWLQRLSPFPQNLNGTDFIPKLLEKETGLLFLVGPSEALLETVAPICASRFPSTPLCGMCDGYREKTETILAQIEAVRPQILLVAMGMPKQELFLSENWPRLVKSGVRLAIAGGAILDFISGHIPRAPSWMRRAHIEWLYRLIREPVRLARRYLIEGPKYLFFIIQEARHHG